MSPQGRNLLTKPLPTSNLKTQLKNSTLKYVDKCICWSFQFIRSQTTSGTKKYPINLLLLIRFNENLKELTQQIKAMNIITQTIWGASNQPLMNFLSLTRTLWDWIFLSCITLITVEQHNYQEPMLSEGNYSKMSDLTGYPVLVPSMFTVL